MIINNIHPLDFGAFLDESNILELTKRSVIVYEHNGKFYNLTVDAPILSEVAKSFLAEEKGLTKS